MADNWLIVETSGRAGAVGVAVDGGVRSAPLDEARRHARDLAATAGRLLADAGLKPADLTGVMVGVGPGSYTGLRVGVMSAKAVAYAVGCPLVAVPTFHTIARQAPAEAGDVWVIADALQGMLYMQRFVGITPADELRIARADDWLTAVTPGGWVTGPGVPVVVDRLPSGVLVADEADRRPTVESVYWVGRGLSPLTRDEMLRLEPLYLRGSSAEEKAKGTTP